jgi:long-chain acyl-CoA synthetase
MSKLNPVVFEYPEFDNVKEIILYGAQKFPDNKAFIVKHKSVAKKEETGKTKVAKDNEEVTFQNITYTQFISDIYDFGTGLYNLGLKGKRVAIISKNCYEWMVAYIACMFGSMIAVPLDKGLTDVEIESSILRSQVDAIIFEDKYTNIIEKVRKDGKSNLREYICIQENKEFKKFYDILEKGKALLEKGEEDFKNNEVDGKALAEMVFTSGTSAQSKIVMLSQYNIVTNIVAMQKVEDFLPTDVTLALLPYHHKFGSTGQIICLCSGMTTAFCDGLRYLQQNMVEYGVTYFVGVPALVEGIYKKLMQAIDKQGKTKLVKTMIKISNGLRKIHIDIRRKLFKQIIDGLGGLRFVVSGAAPLDIEAEKAMNDLGIHVVQGYGMTEASPVLVCEGHKYSRYGSIGLPLPNVEVKLDGEDSDGIGELVVKGPNVMLGYYNDEEKTKETIIDEWLYTGDLAKIDDDGFVYIVGRKKDMIVLKNGKKIFPDEIESLVNKLDLVEECMVFGLPKDDDVSLAVKIKYDKAVVSEKYADLSKEDLNKELWMQIKDINKELPTYKYMKHLYIEENDFVKTTTNKIKRNEEMKKIENEHEIENKL